MNFVSSFLKNSESNFENVSIPSAGDLFLKALKTTSGASEGKRRRREIFNRIIGFKGVCDGLGTSLLVANTALALADYGLRVCVVDTSILRPIQDVYLKTNVRDYERKDIVDWFDMPFSDKNVLNASKLTSAISVLSFTNRTILDLLSTADTEELVITAFKQLSDKFDVVLVDICNEPSAVVACALQKSHAIYQVWSNDRQSMNSIDSAIKNCSILACTSDKLRWVITSNTVDDIRTNWDKVLGKYNFKQLGHVGMAIDIARANSAGESLWKLPSNSESISEFNDCICCICAKILDLDSAGSDRGMLTTEAILSGNVEGTLTKKEHEKYMEDEPLRERNHEDTSKALNEMARLSPSKSTEKAKDEEVIADVEAETNIDETDKREGILSFLGFGKRDRR